MTLYMLLVAAVYIFLVVTYSQTCYYHTKSLPAALYGHIAVYSDYQNSVYIFGGKTNGSADYNTVYKWDLNVAHSWFEPIDTTPTSTFFSYGNNAVIMNDIIYFIGIQDTNIASGNIYMFDVETESWLSNSQLSAPIIPLSHGCLTENDTHIFLVDGYNGFDSKDREPVIQIYDVASGNWSGWYLGLGDYTGGFRYQYCSLINNELFILGGRIGSPQYTDQILKWDAIQESVSYVSKLPIAQSWGVAVYSNHFIYTIGSYPFNININVFDVVSKTVTNTVYQMTQLLSAPAAIILNNKLYIFGGENDNFQAVSTVQICDLVISTEVPTTALITTTDATTTTDVYTTTSTPTTSIPTTTNPTTNIPTTSNPTAAIPTTSAPTTSNPTTLNPTTLNPTTSLPTTANSTTSNPTTSTPTTSIPTTATPTTIAPTTQLPTTAQPTTVSPTTSAPTYSSIHSAAQITTTFLATTTDMTEYNFMNESISQSDNSLVILIIIAISILCLILLFCILIYTRLKKSNAEQYQSNSNQLSITNLEAVKSVSSQTPRNYVISSPQSFKSNANSMIKQSFVDDIELMEKKSEINETQIVPATDGIVTPGATTTDEGVNTNIYETEGETTTQMDTLDVYAVTDDGSNVNFDNDIDVDSL